MQIGTHTAAKQRASGVELRPSSVVRLDVIQFPYGPCPAALEALEAPPAQPCEKLATNLRKRLGERYRVPFESIVLLEGVDRGLERIVNQTTGPAVGFPPSAAASMLASSGLGRQSLWIARGPGRESSVEIDHATDIPPDSMAVIDSPSDPLGSVLSASVAVRLARACRVLIIDERYAEFAGMSSLPLSIEFENIVVLRSFETWTGIQNPSCAWAAASPRMASAIGLEGRAPTGKALAAAIATLDNLKSVEVTLRLLREERSRLFRFLRKLSFLEPIPSWGPFLAARVDLVPREMVIGALVKRGVFIHAPTQPGLERIVRMSLGSRLAMDRLRNALLDLAPEIVGS